MIAVLIREARARIAEFAARGFYHDGYWRQGESTAHRRVLGQIEGWLDHLLAGTDAAPRRRRPPTTSMLALARDAGAASLTAPPSPEVQQVTLSASTPRAPSRLPVLLGGAGLARLAVGAGEQALDLELRGMGNYGTPYAQRLALRVAVGGRPVLGDLDDQPPTASGYDRATVSHNTVVIDGLNQRETPAMAREDAPGGDFLFYAADPDFQVVTLDDPRAYPQSTGPAGRYRQTVIAVSGPKVRYAVSIFEVWGGLQHDQLFHAAARFPGAVAGRRRHGARSGRPPAADDPPHRLGPCPGWPLVCPVLRRSRPAGPGPPDSPLAGRADRPRRPGRASAPAGRRADDGDHGPRARPDRRDTPKPSDEPGRAALVLRRTSTDGGTLKSMFVTVFEPVGGAPPLLRVGRVATSPESVVVYLETAEGKEHLAVNLTPGTPRTVPLADGSSLTTDGLAVRLSDRAMVLAGGTFAESSGRQVRQVKVSGKIRGVVRRQLGGGSRLVRDRRPPARSRPAGGSRAPHPPRRRHHAGLDPAEGREHRRRGPTPCTRGARLRARPADAGGPLLSIPAGMSHPVRTSFGSRRSPDERSRTSARCFRETMFADSVDRAWAFPIIITVGREAISKSLSTDRSIGFDHPVSSVPAPPPVYHGLAGFFRFPQGIPMSLTLGRYRAGVRPGLGRTDLEAEGR